MDDRSIERVHDRNNDRHNDRSNDRVTARTALDERPVAPITAHDAAIRHRAWLAIGGGLLAGIVADQLIRRGAGGVSLTAGFLTLLAGLVAVVRARLRYIPRRLVGLFVAAALLACACAVRDAEYLVFFNSVATFALLLIAAAPESVAGTLTLHRARLRDVIVAYVHTILGALVGPFAVRPAFGGEASRRGARPASIAVVRSLALASVLTVGFGALLAAGDPVFARLFAVDVGIDPGVVLSHVLLTAIFAWPVIGTLAAAAGVHAIRRPTVTPPLPVLNRLDVGATLLALDVLFGAFVLLQLRVLFGGADYVQSATGLTMAEYARNGFFVLAFTTALTLGALNGLDALFGRDSLAGWHPARRMALLLVALLAVVMLSAAVRMNLYVQSFGWSVDRIIAFVAIGWLAVVALWFSVTVLAGRSRGFIFGAATSALVALGVLNVVGADVIVARDINARAARGIPVDYRYAVHALSADAVPVLVPGLLAAPSAALSPSQPNAQDVQVSAAAPALFRRCDAARVLLERWADRRTAFEGGANVGRLRAHRAVRQHRFALESIACPAPPSR